MPCATERASRTASAEQQDDAASFSTSAHSSSVTATAPAPTSSAATAESTPPLIATSVRAGVERHRGARARRRSQRAMQRVRGQIGGVQLARREPAELLRDRGTPTRAASSSNSPETSVTAAEPAAVSAPQPEASKRRLDHAIAGDAHRDADQIPADRPAGGAVEAPGKHDAAPDGRGEVFSEALAIHERRFYDRRLIAQSVRPALSKLAVELGARRRVDQRRRRA